MFSYQVVFRVAKWGGGGQKEREEKSEKESSIHNWMYTMITQIPVYEENQQQGNGQWKKQRDGRNWSMTDDWHMHTQTHDSSAIIWTL